MTTSDLDPKEPARRWVEEAVARNRAKQRKGRGAPAGAGRVAPSVPSKRADAEMARLVVREGVRQRLWDRASARGESQARIVRELLVSWLREDTARALPYLEEEHHRGGQLGPRPAHDDLYLALALPRSLYAALLERRDGDRGAVLLLLTEVVERAFLPPNEEAGRAARGSFPTVRSLAGEMGRADDTVKAMMAFHGVVATRRSGCHALTEDDAALMRACLGGEHHHTWTLREAGARLGGISYERVRQLCKLHGIPHKPHLTAEGLEQLRAVYAGPTSTKRRRKTERSEP